MTIDFVEETKDLFDTDTVRDENFGGQLLHKTALEVARELAGAEDDVGQAWLALVGEVLAEHRWEREILIDNLTISEFRPRTFFSLLPDASNWHEVKVPVRDQPIVGERVKCLHVKPKIPRTPPAQEHAPERLSVLLPISNGYRRTFCAMACLAYDVSRSRDMDRFEVDLHVCVNYTDDNTHYEVTRFANTMGLARGFGLFFYSLDDRKLLGPRSRPGMVRTSVLNVMLTNLCRRSDGMSGNQFVHFCDDDIFIHPGAGLIAGNIEDLRRNEELELISGAYTCDDDTGFSAISSIRKRTKFVHCQSGHAHIDRLANVYGGCLTTTLKRLKRVVEKSPLTTGDDPDVVRIPTNSGEHQIGFDPILTVLSNDHVAVPDADELSSLPEELLASLRGYATCTRCVGQPEATSIVGMVKRYWRDRVWGRNTVDPEAWEQYRKLRRRSFKTIENNVESRGSARDQVAHRWHSQIHEVVKGWDNDTAAKPPWLTDDAEPSSDGPAHIRWDTHKTRHQICKDIVEDLDVVNAFRVVAEEFPNSTDVTALLENYAGAADRELEFPKFAQALVTLKREDVAPVLRKNKHLFHLYTITEESVANCSKMLELADDEGKASGPIGGMLSKRLDALEARYPVCLAKILACAFPGVFALASDVRLSGPAAGNWVEQRLGCTSISSQRSYAVFVSKQKSGSIPIRVNTKSEDPLVAEKPLFIRYFDVLGPTRFHRDSPRRVVYLHVLGERVIERVLELTERIRADVELKSQSKDTTTLTPKEEDDRAQPTTVEATVEPATVEPAPVMPTIVKLVDTYYPTLEDAVVHYAGPERRVPFHRMMHSLVIQESLRGKTFPLARAVLGDEQWKAVARCLAQFLGALHAVTLGFRSFLYDRVLHGHFNYDVSFEPCWPLLRLLIEHLDQIRLLKTGAYSNWLAAGGDRPRTLGRMKGFDEIPPATIASKVANLVRQDGHQLADLWADVCRNSSDFHVDFGAVGHQGLYAANLYLVGDGKQRADRRVYTGDCRIEMVRLADFAGIAMIDPAVEAGTVLAELMSVRIREEDGDVKVDDRSLPDIRDAFREEYVGAFEFYRTYNPLIQGNAAQRRKLSVIDLAARTFQMAGFALLSTHQNDKEQLQDESRRRIIQNCVDLLHAGTSIGLRFRDYSPFFGATDS